MKRLFSVVAAGVVACAACAGAFGAVQVSNIGETPDAGGRILPGFPYATAFTTGPGSGWLLNSVAAALFNDGAGDTSYSMKIYTDAGGVPGTLVEELPAFLGAPGFSTPSFLSVGTVLLPSTTYWLVAESDPEFGFFLGTTSLAETSSTGWTIADGSLAGEPGPTWIPSAGVVNRFEIDADAVPLPLAVTSVSGCNDAGQTTIDCPSAGNVALVVGGTSFTPTTVVLIGGVPALDTVFVSSTELHCTLPPGTGTDLPVTAVDSAAVAFLPGALSYFEAACLGDGNDDGVVDFNDIVAALGNWLGVCP